MPGPSGYVTGIERPDFSGAKGPDYTRQRTQSRAKGFPYDTPVKYGGAKSQDDGGAAYDDGGLSRPLTPKYGERATAEAAGTPISYKGSEGDADGSGGIGTIPGQSRGWAGGKKDDLDFSPIDVFGEAWQELAEALDLEYGSFDDCDGDGYPGPSLKETFGVGEHAQGRVWSLLETLDRGWDGREGDT